MEESGLGKAGRKVLSYLMVKLRRHIFGMGTYYLYEKVLDRDTEELLGPDGLYCMQDIGDDMHVFSVLSIFPPKLTTVHTTSVALNSKAKGRIDIIPYKVNFDEGEVCSGGSYTVPEFRNRGLYSWMYSFIFHRLYVEGYKLDKASVNKNNKISIHVHEKVGFKRIGEGFYLNILGLRMWRENKVS